MIKINISILQRQCFTYKGIKLLYVVSRETFHLSARYPILLMGENVVIY